MKQSTNRVFMVRPANFMYNAETAVSNSFQTNIEKGDLKALNDLAILEFDRAVQILRDAGIDVTVFQDSTSPVKPDAIFPNNWISIHQDGKYNIYPMESLNRRLERRNEIIDELADRFNLIEGLDMTGYENENKFLEGTGSVVFDHPNRKAYAVISTRTDKGLLNILCEEIKYDLVPFHAVDEKNAPIYHTNVVMALGTGYAIICLESVKDIDEKTLITEQLRKGNIEIIEITYEQLKNFAGNMIELEHPNGKKLLVMSQSAYNSLREDQLKRIRSYAEPLVIDVPTIEKIGGGSIRCMIAEIFA